MQKSFLDPGLGARFSQQPAFLLSPSWEFHTSPPQLRKHSRASLCGQKLMSWQTRHYLLRELTGMSSRFTRSQKSEQSHSSLNSRYYRPGSWIPILSLFWLLEVSILLGSQLSIFHLSGLCACTRATRGSRINPFPVNSYN